MSDTTTCQQFMLEHAARLRAWASHAEHASFQERADAIFAASVAEQMCRLRYPDAALPESAKPHPFDIQPWMHEVGEHDRTPVDYPGTRRRKT